jgi:hypothetical protein
MPPSFYRAIQREKGKASFAFKGSGLRNAIGPVEGKRDRGELNRRRIQGWVAEIIFA